METIILRIEGMSCEHCAKAVAGAVEALPGVASALVDLDAKTATIEHDPAQSPVEKLRFAIEEEGYEVVA